LPRLLHRVAIEQALSAVRGEIDAMSDGTVLKRFVFRLGEAEGALYITTLKSGEGATLVHGLATPEKIERLRRALAEYFGVQ
jgi:hypothetical protein